MFGYNKQAPNCLVLHGTIPSSIIRSSAIFVYIRHFYISEVKGRLNVTVPKFRHQLYLLTSRDRRRQFSAIFVHISEVKVRLRVTQSVEIGSSALFVDIS